MTQGGQSTSAALRRALDTPIRGPAHMIPKPICELHAADSSACHPEILRKAFTGPHAEQRLRRFARCLAYPTLTEAAHNLGIHPPVLTNQIRILEQDPGQPLLKRAERGRAMQATECGQQVADAVGEVPGAWWAGRSGPEDRCSS